MSIMSQVTILSLLALPTGPVRIFAAKDLEVPTGALHGVLSTTSAFAGTLIVSSAFSGTLTVTPAYTAKLGVANVST